MIRKPDARMKAALAVVGILLGVAEIVALSSGESLIWSVSKVVWQATLASPLVPFAVGIVAGHFFFPKGVCVHCGFRPWASDATSRMAFDGVVIRFGKLFAREWGKESGNEPDINDLKRRAGFPVEG